MNRIRHAFCSVFFLSAAFLSAGPDSLRLLPNFDVTNTVNLQEDSWVRSFRIQVPADVYEMKIELLNSPADLDLLLYDDSDSLVYYSEESYFNESMTVRRGDDPGLYSGSYRLEVAYQLSMAPEVNGETLEEIPFGIRLSFIRLGKPVAIEPDTEYEFELKPEEAMVKYFTFELPDDSEFARVDIYDTTADLDFAFNPGSGITDPYDALYLKNSFLSSEHASFSLQQISDRRFYFIVLTPGYEDRVIPFKLRVGATSQAPSALADRAIELPDFDSLSGFEKYAAATVELTTDASGGSGCLITSDGYILTNHHVVMSSTGEPAEEVYVSITGDPRIPPRESYIAHLVAYNEDRDLALLKISKNFYGSELEDIPEFPYYEIGNPDLLHLGEQMHFLGYPTVGGLGSKVTVALTRGIVSGFEDIGYGLMVKTDGEINYGNSGGAAFDEDFRLLGLPTQINYDSGGKLAYVFSVLMVPPSWWTIAGVQTPF